ELITPLSVGLVHDATGRVVRDPDTAGARRPDPPVCHLRSDRLGHRVRQGVHRRGLSFPWRHRKGPRASWTRQPLAHHTVLRVLHNPRYAGAFTYGPHHHLKQPNGKATSRLLPGEEWISFIPDAPPRIHHRGPIRRNRARLAANAQAHGRDRAAGPAREGTALLQGIIICGRCGRMTVRYHHRRSQQLPTYMCQRDGIEHARPICATVPGADLDQRIGQLLLDTITPLTIEAAFAVTAELEQRAAQPIRCAPRTGAPPRFRIGDPIRSHPEWRGMSAGETAEIQP
ncbi:MAG: recombinase family protein, partial [Actinobacteria bacterium]|nr:recombinase family protein [Actinomycetota bacterium]